MIYPIDWCVFRFDYDTKTKGCEVSVLSDTSSCMLAVEFEERTTGGVEDVCAR